MIIPDEDDAQKIKDPPVAIPTVRCPEPAASRPFGLPDYETSQALAFRDFNESQVTLYKPPPRRRFLDSRFWRAALVSLVVYIFLTLVIGVPIIVHKEYENAQKYSYNALSSALDWPSKSSVFNHPGTTNGSSPNPPGIVPLCNQWSSVELLDAQDGTIVLATFQDFVSPSGEFSIASNASVSNDINLVQGAFYTGINPNATVQDAVLSIIMEASSFNVFNSTFACWAVAENFTQLTLYAPNDLTSSDSILYNVTLLFPQTSVPSRVDTLATFLPMFDQRFSTFDDNVSFNQVSIEGPVSRVMVDSLQAKRILVDTSLEPITGTFHAQASLAISTIMAPIVANISLYNDINSQFPTFLDVHTGNSNLTANVILSAPNTNPSTRPNFIANLRTFSAALSASVLHDSASPPTAIELNVINDLGPVDVTLDSLFEGIFQVSTKQASVSVTQGNASAPDLSMPGQTRCMVVESNSTARSFGWIGWGSEGTPWNGYEQGEVLIDSSLADVTLSFLG